MSALQFAPRQLAALFATCLALFSVACAGGNDSPQYTAGDIQGGVTGTSTQALECESGATATCTIWLGQHGDLSNCAHGLDVCSNGSWTGCIDDDTLASNPDLYSSLAGDE
ncbi:MAG: hypothetical protein ABI895_40455 [Deltaproteobacteria bacterium]